MGRTCCVHKLFFVLVLTFRTTYAHNMFYPCSKPRTTRFRLSLQFSCMYLTCNSMHNLMSYFGLVDARISASKIVLLGHMFWRKPHPKLHIFTNIWPIESVWSFCFLLLVFLSKKYQSLVRNFGYFRNCEILLWTAQSLCCSSHSEVRFASFLFRWIYHCHT